MIQPSAREGLNYLLIDIVAYLDSVRLKYKLEHKDISNTIYELKQYFPQASCLLMLLLLNEYCVSHVEYSTAILDEIYSLLEAMYDRV